MVSPSHTNNDPLLYSLSDAPPPAFRSRWDIAFSDAPPPACLQVPLLYSLTDAQLWQLAKAMQTETMDRGHVVFKKGEGGWDC